LVDVERVGRGVVAVVALVVEEDRVLAMSRYIERRSSPRRTSWETTG
jgi:hypothetical protein